MNETTPTGVPIEFCQECDRFHPTNRSHCHTCGAPTIFLNPDGICLKCRKEKVQHETHS